LKIENLEKEILQTLHYFFFFDYPPSFKEIYTFLKKKVSKKSLASILEKMRQKSIIVIYKQNNKSISNFKFPLQGKQIENSPKYTPPQYSINQSQSSKLKSINNLAIKQFNNWHKRYVFSQQKLNNFRFRLYIKLLSWFPQIHLVGLSGTVAMMNAKEKDDIDLFIISAKKRIWTARIITLLIAQLLGLRRRASETNVKDKVCLNLFFDGLNLKIPRYKQSEYVAHEALQMKPLINKNNTYERFLVANQWAFRIFPNAGNVIASPSETRAWQSHRERLLPFDFAQGKLPRNDKNILGNLLENTLKKLQLTIIKQHQTSEIVTNTQLWFFPEDFENKLNGLTLKYNKLISGQAQKRIRYNVPI